MNGRFVPPEIFAARALVSSTSRTTFSTVAVRSRGVIAWLLAFSRAVVLAAGSAAEAGAAAR